MVENIGQGRQSACCGHAHAAAPQPAVAPGDALAGASGHAHARVRELEHDHDHDHGHGHNHDHDHDQGREDSQEKPHGHEHCQVQSGGIHHHPHADRHDPSLAKVAPARSDATVMPAQGNVQMVQYRIANMDCPVEETLIRNKLEPLAGVVALDFNLMGRLLAVQHTLAGTETLSAALKDIGMQAQQLDAGMAAEDSAGSGGLPARQKYLLVVSGISAAAAEALAWYSGAEASPAVMALVAVSIFSGGLSTLKKGWIALRTLTLNINFLMSLAVFGALAIGQLPEAAMVLFLFAVAELIEGLSLQRARNAVSGLLKLAPQTASVLDAAGAWRQMPVAQLEVGSLFRVRAGERFALDGVVASGSSTVNQAPITGESLPVEKTPGDPVYAGTINEDGVLEVRASSNSGNSTLARIARTIEQTQGSRAPTQRFVDTFARCYTPVVVVLAVLVALLPPLIGGAPFIPWLYKALVMLVIACPCALVISTPVTVVSGLTAAARRGILIKGGEFLEAGHGLKAIAFDKTGTLTCGQPEVMEVLVAGAGQDRTAAASTAAATSTAEGSTADGSTAERSTAPVGRAATASSAALAGAAALFTQEEIILVAASLDAQSDHPLARAIVQAGPHARSYRSMQQVENLPGRGLRAQMDGQTVHLGNARLMTELGLLTHDVQSMLDQASAQARSAVLLAIDQRVVGVITLADALREQAAAAIARLNGLGIATVMLTGDNQAAAASIGAQAGIGLVLADLLPEDKLDQIRALQARHGKVGMMGDGINDAPALAQADIGFAMGAAGSDIAIETADVALMDDDLHKLASFIGLARATRRILWQNIVLALGIKLVFFTLALSGTATLWMAVFADVGASLLVVGNGLRLLRK
ncbi:MAG: heavy metal translocating P-type ATPase [Janthinobacterium lividum]